MANEDALSKDELFDLQKGKANIVAELCDNEFLKNDSQIERAMRLLKTGNHHLVKFLTVRIRKLKLHYSLVGKPL